MSKRRVELESVAVLDDGKEGSNVNEAFKVARMEEVQMATTTPQIQVVTVPAPQAPAMVRTSARVLRKKEERKDSDSEPMSEGNNQFVEGGREAEDEETAGPAAGSPPLEKPRRTWELWSASDKALFFEALNESGKNFCAVESFFQAKLGGKGVSSKNKDQIRTFYYRTWHKINNFIDFPENVKKSAREIYGLVNYGELRKRAGGSLTMDERMGARLSELVFRGSTALRVRGKTMRVRTPICRALKKLNAKAEATKSRSSTSASAASVPPSPASVSSRLRVPTTLTLTLKPLLQRDLVRVHGHCMQNPNVEVKVGMQQRISEVLRHFDKKWSFAGNKKSVSDFKREGEDSSVEVDSVSDATSVVNQAELWFLPKPGTKLKTPVVTSMEPVTHVSLSLSSLQEKLQKKMKEKEKQELAAKEKAASIVEAAAAALATADQDVKTNGGEAGSKGVQQFLSGIETEKGEESEKEKKTEIIDGAAVEKSDKKEPVSKANGSDGWTKDTAEQLTIGQLYLMLGANEKRNVNLYYTWKSNDSEVLSEAVNPLARFAHFAGCELGGKKQQQKLLLGSPASSSRAAHLANGGNNALVRSPVQTTNGFSSPKSNGAVAKSDPGSPLAVPLDASPGRANGNHTAVSNGTNGAAKTAAEFRRPNPVPPIRPAPGRVTADPAQAQAFRQQLDLLLPKFSHRRGRPALTRKTGNSVNRPLQARSVIQGQDGKVKLRLLMPGTGPGAMQQKMQIMPQQKQLQIQQQAQQKQHPVFHLQQQFPLQQQQHPLQQQQHPLQQQQQQQLVPLLITPAAPVIIDQPHPQNGIPHLSIPESSTPIGGALSPTGSLSSLFDPESYGVGVAKNGETTPTKGDHFLDSVLENSNSVSSLLQTPPRHRPTPPTSPSRAISDSYLPELSLSSLLSFGESPSKGGSSSSSGLAGSSAAAVMANLNEDSTQSTGSEVDRQLMSMMNESSVDFTAKFAKLTSHVLE